MKHGCRINLFQFFQIPTMFHIQIPTMFHKNFCFINLLTTTKNKQTISNIKILTKYDFSTVYYNIFISQKLNYSRIAKRFKNRQHGVCFTRNLPKHITLQHLLLKQLIFFYFSSPNFFIIRM